MVKRIEESKNPKVCDFSGFTFTGTDGKTYGYDEKGAPCAIPNKPIDTQLINIVNTGNPFTNWGASGSFGNSTNTGTIPTFNLPNMNIPTNIPLSNNSISEIKQIGDLHNHAHNLSEFIVQYENEPWEKVVKKERPFGIKALTVKKESHIKPHAAQVEQAKIELKAVQEQIANLSICISTSQKTSLDYSNRGFSAEDVKNVKAQEGCYELVSFKNNNIGCDGLKHLIYSEEGQTALTKGSSDLKEIYQGMLAKQGVMIAKLDLSNCNIGGLSSDKLGQAIYGSSLNSLQHLNLSNNNITDEGIYAFGNAWFCETSPSLRTLNLSNNKLTDNGASSLSWSFKKGNLYYLNHLDVSGNSEITDVGKAKLVTTVNEALNPNLAITLEKHNDTSGVWNFIKKAFNYYAEEHSKKLAENGKATLAVYGDNNWANCKKLIHDAGKEMSMGVVKHSSNIIAQQLVQKAPPQVKGATVGAIFVAAGIDTALAVDVENLGYCIAAINKKVENFVFDKDTMLPENSVGFLGENGVGEYVDF